MGSANCGRCGMTILDEGCSVCRGEIDWPAFWSSLPPREQWEAAKAMPKIAGPWDRDGRRYAAHDAPPTCPVASGHHTAHDRASADAALRDAGWLLVDEETEGADGSHRTE